MKGGRGNSAAIGGGANAKVAMKACDGGRLVRFSLTPARSRWERENRRPQSNCSGHRRARARFSLSHCQWSADQPQRGCVLQPRVARHELPWEPASKPAPTPTGLRHAPQTDVPQPRWGWEKLNARTQGSPLGAGNPGLEDAAPLGQPDRKPPRVAIHPNEIFQNDGLPVEPQNRGRSADLQIGELRPSVHADLEIGAPVHGKDDLPLSMVLQPSICRHFASAPGP